ncbi:MAG: VOC family protein [Saprospiraceae bacterium]|nr:VOC family protein [Saprospiraceae bacterium]
MARVSTYLNFSDHTEAAFNFYKSVFGGEFTAPGIRRFGDIPSSPEMPPMSDKLKHLVMHVELKILNCHFLMGTDAPEEMGFMVQKGNNVYINLEPDTKAETKEIFTKLSEGGTVTEELKDMFWGGYFGSLIDKYGIHWMFNCMGNS